MKYSGASNQNMRASPDGRGIPMQYYGMQPQFTNESVAQPPSPYYLSYPTQAQYTPMFKDNDENTTANTEKRQTFKKKLKASSFTIDNSEEEDKDFEIFKHTSKLIDEEFDSRLNLGSNEPETAKRPNAPIEVNSLNQGIWNEPRDQMAVQNRIDPGAKGSDGGVKVGISQIQEPPGFSKVQQNNNQTLDLT